MSQVSRCMLFILLTGVFLGWQVAEAAGAENKGVTSNIIINAAPSKVWEVLSTTGNFNDRLQSVHGDEAIVEQKFATLPLMGTATVLVKAKVKQMERIDFTMIQSDQLKWFAGAWVMVPTGRQATRLHLHMEVDPGLPVPQFLVNKFILGKVKSRLKKVKGLAEQLPKKPQSDSH